MQNISNIIDIFTTENIKLFPLFKTDKKEIEQMYKLIMNNPTYELLFSVTAALFGSTLHLFTPAAITGSWALLHEILQDGAWMAAIVVGIKAGKDFYKSFKNKKR